MRKFVGLWAISVLLAGSAPAQDLAATKGFLKPGAIDVMKVLPPAPVAGDARYDSDRAVFKATRRFVGSSRWAMATTDVNYDPRNMLANFSCALGVVLDPSKNPHLSRLARMANNDTQQQANIAKNAFQRLRPFQVDDGEICQAKSELAGSYDYPSGHTTGGWTWALVLSDVAPDRASEILARGRAYGESRIVCGAHNASAVEAGRLAATVTMTAVRATPGYRRELKAAQAEFAAAKKARKKPAPAMCEAEKGLVAINIFAPQ